MEQEEHYDEKALSRILKRAAELEVKTGKAERSSGYSLAEIESIASEAGISTDSIRAAAAELAGSGHGHLQIFLGASINLEERCTLETPDKEGLIQRLAADLPASLPGGSIQGNHNHLHWRSESMDAYRSGRAINLDLRLSSEGSLIVVARAQLGVAAAGLFGGIMGGLGIGAGVGIGVGVGIGALGSPVFAVIVPVASLGLSWLLARGIFRLVSQHTRLLLKRLVNDVQDLARR